MRMLRIVALAFGTLAAAALVIAVALFVNGWNTLHGRQAHAVPELRVAPADSLLERGRHLAAIQCASCHAPDQQLPLAGGDDNLLAGTPLGVLHAPNLTPAGVLGRYTDGQLSRAIREGVDRDGRAMLGMPSSDSRVLSDRDLAALITYLRAQPAVPREVPARRLTPAAYLVLGLRLAETSVQHPVAVAVPHPEEGLSPEYGDYLATYLGCRSCHGRELDGRGRDAFAPAGADLVRLASKHDLAAFSAAVREGRALSEARSLESTLMPWRVYASLTDTEIGALYTTLQARARR